MSQDTMLEADLRSHVAEAEAVFAHGWVCIGHVAMLPKTGDYAALDLIGNLLVAVRGQDRIRVLSRVCLHRWASLVEGVGNARRFTCPFHAWSYALDGRLIAAAFMEQAEGFERSKCRLPEIRTEIAADGLIFVNLAPAQSGEEGPFPLLEMDQLEAVAAGPAEDTLVDLGWKDVLDQAATASPDILKAPPNCLISREPGKIQMQMVFPNGPNETLVRTINCGLRPLRAITDEAPTTDLPN